MATTFEQLITGLSVDPWTGEPLEKKAPDFSALYALKVKDYQKWLRKQIRTYGRRTELGDAQHAPVENFVKEVTGFFYNLSAMGEVEVYVEGIQYDLFTGSTDLAYYLYEDNESEDFSLDPVMIIKAGFALDAALRCDPDATLVLNEGD